MLLVEIEFVTIITFVAAVLLNLIVLEYLFGFQSIRC